MFFLLSAQLVAQPVVETDETPWLVSADGKVGVKVLQQDKNASMSRLRFAEGAQVPSHRHPDSTELLTILSGSGVMTVDGREYRVKAGSVVCVPQGAEHSFEALSDGEAVQVYSPPGPEERFLKWKTESVRP